MNDEAYITRNFAYRKLFWRIIKDNYFTDQNMSIIIK
jgi:hypothetical protein